jgi:hypothetical protein
LKALAKNWRQNARNSAKWPARPLLRVGEGRESEVMLAMTNPVFFRRLPSREAFFSTLVGSFSRQLLKLGFNCFYSRQKW